MTTRYLASIAGVHCAVPLRDQLSSLITHTQYLADRNIYAAVLTRQQWDKLREEFWETGRQCDHGRLVPDIDFIASDGKVFLDFAECQKHEAGIGIVSPTNAGRSILDAFNAVATDQEKQTLAQMGATCNPGVPACYQYTEANMREYALSVIQKSQVGEAANSPDSYSGTVGSSPTPAIISDTASLDTVAKVEAEEARVADQIEHLETVTPPTSLEDRMLVVVGGNYMAITLVASLLKVEESAVRAVVAESNKFEMSSTQKSIRKAATP